MIATELISARLIPLRTSDTGRAALSVMSDFYVKHLPIVNDAQQEEQDKFEQLLQQEAEEKARKKAMKKAKKAKMMSAIGTGEF